MRFTYPLGVQYLTPESAVCILVVAALALALCWLISRRGGR